MRQRAWPILLALVVLATLPLVGWIALVAAGAVFVGGIAAARWSAAGVVLALGGGLIASASALQAVLRHDPGEPRWWLGVAALGLALLASSALLLHRRLLAVAAGVLGVVAINFFDINTFYVVALPLWFAAVLAPSQVLHSHRPD